MLFKHYHGLLDELIQEQNEAGKSNEEKIFIEEQRAIAETLKEQAIEEYDSGYGTYDGFKYEDYIAGLNSEIKELVVEQLNFTKNSFLEAQELKQEMLANGSTYDEAMQAYLEMLAIPKATIEQFNEKYLESDEN